MLLEAWDVEEDRREKLEEEDVVEDVDGKKVGKEEDPGKEANPATGLAGNTARKRAGSSQITSATRDAISEAVAERLRVNDPEALTAATTAAMLAWSCAKAAASESACENPSAPLPQGPSTLPPPLAEYALRMSECIARRMAPMVEVLEAATAPAAVTVASCAREMEPLPIVCRASWRIESGVSDSKSNGSKRTTSDSGKNDSRVAVSLSRISEVAITTGRKGWAAICT